MKLSDNGLIAIERFEGLRLHAYHDAVGVLTIGYGSTGKHVHPGMSIPEEYADKLLRSDVARFEDAVTAMVKVDLTQGQYDALVSFAFNLGAHALHGSSLLRYLNQGKYNRAADEFHKWNHAGHHELAGLTRRRAEEKERFLA